MSAHFANFIGGEWVAPATGEYFENRNPADWDDVIGCFPRSGAEDVARAAASARRGFARWSKTPAPVRGEVLHRVGDLLVQRKEEIARAMTREMGKVLAETRGDVQEGIDTAHYAHTEGRRRSGPGAGGRAGGRVRHYRTALHRDEPADRARARARRVREAAVRPGRPAAPRSRSGRDQRGGPAGQRGGPQEGRLLRRRRPAGGRRDPGRRGGAVRQGARERLVLPADGARGRAARHAGRAGGDLRPRPLRDQGGLSQRGDPCEQRRAVRPLKLALHARRE